MALDTKSKAERYRIAVKFTLKNVYYFEKNMAWESKDMLSRHTGLEAQCGQNLQGVAYCACLQSYIMRHFLRLPWLLSPDCLKT